MNDQKAEGGAIDFGFLSLGPIIDMATGKQVNPNFPAELCQFQSPSADDGYCRCILPPHAEGNHKCVHGWLR